MHGRRTSYNVRKFYIKERKTITKIKDAGSTIRKSARYKLSVLKMRTQFPRPTPCRAEATPLRPKSRPIGHTPIPFPIQPIQPFELTL